MSRQDRVSILGLLRRSGQDGSRSLPFTVSVNLIYSIDLIGEVSTQTTQLPGLKLGEFCPR